MKKLALILLCFFSFFGFSQNLNQYKYAQVPSKFSFLNWDFISFIFIGFKLIMVGEYLQFRKCKIEGGSFV
jgi:hypothetical protein